jgi:phospholipase C
MTTFSISRPVLAGAVAVLLSACQGPGNSTLSTPASSPLAPLAAHAGIGRPIEGNPINHVIVIVQENRTVDNLFQGYPGADTQSWGLNDRGETVPLAPTDLNAPFDLSHKYGAFLEDYDYGRMDGFNEESEHCYRQKSKCPPPQIASYGYVPQYQVQPYWDLAGQYVLADEMFQTNEGPSFPAHQYLVSGTSTIANGSSYRASENVNDDDQGHQGGCDSRSDALVETVDPAGHEGNPVYPCFMRLSIIDRLNDAGISWHYYQAYGGSGQWHAVDAIEQIYNGPSFSNVVWPSSRVLRDIHRGVLSAVSFVTPTTADSDHAGTNRGKGPAWVASIVDAIGNSQYWQDSAIIVVWDDWGGWYDHVPTIHRNSYELGFRVPMLVISAYAKQGYVAHAHYEFGSVLKFIEETYGLESLGTTDVDANDLRDCFTFNRMRPFKPIHANRDGAYFLRELASSTPVDDDQ